MITQVPNWQTLTPQEILDWLLGTNSVPNTRAWTFNGLVTQVSAEFAGKIELSLKLLANANVPFASSSFNSLSTTGLPLYEAHVPTLVTVLANASQSFPEELRWDEQTVEIINSLGSITTPRWQEIGYVTEPTVEQITTEKTTALTAAWYEAKDAVVREGLANLTINTQEQVRDVLGGG
jgi:hypothetical protein